MKEVKEQNEIVYPEECPECRNTDLSHSDWSDNQFLWIMSYCKNCNFQWREKVDYTS